MVSQEINYFYLHLKDPEIHAQMRKYRSMQNDNLFYVIFVAIVLNTIVKSVQVATNKTSNQMFILFVAVFSLICALFWASIRGTKLKDLSSFIFNVIYLCGTTVCYVLASRDQLPDFIKVT